MLYDRNSKIREVWRHPVGRDALLCLMRRLGRSEHWPEGRMAGRMPLSSLDRVAGRGFADALAGVLMQQPDYEALHQPDETRSWWKEAVVYRIYLPSFMDGDHDGMGDFSGVVQRLPYLEKLGVDTLWLTPVLDTPAVGERAVRDYRLAMEAFGCLDGFEMLAEAAHDRGMRILMGVDIAATSPQHNWFRAAMEGQGAPFYDYYIFRSGSPDAPPNNWGRPGGVSAWRWVPELEAWTLQLLGRQRVDLNWENPVVRQEMKSILEYWAERGADGFYLGSATMIAKTDYANAHPALAGPADPCGYEKCAYSPELSRYLRELRPARPDGSPVLMMAEAGGIGAGLAKMLTGARGALDMVMDASYLNRGQNRREQDSGLTLAAIKQYFLRAEEEFGQYRWMSLFFENQDMPRLVSRLGASPIYRGILAKLLGTLLLTLRGTPIVYQGEELGLPNTRFASINELCSPQAQRMYQELKERMGDAAALQAVLPVACDHARVPMPWSAGLNGGFTGAAPWMRLNDGIDYLNAGAQMEDSKSVWSHYRRLIALRKKSAGLVYGSFNPVFIKNKRVFCYFRIYEGEKWYVEINLTEREAARPGRILPAQHLVMSNYDTPARNLRPYEANLYRLQG